MTQAKNAGENASDQLEKKATTAKKADESPVYVVADGKSIVCQKGVIGPGQEMKTDWLHGGKATADALVNRGLLVKD